MLELSVKDAKVLVASVKDSYQLARDAWASAIEQSIACGGKLAYVKSQIEHGRWLPFLDACEIPQRTATELMRMHDNRELLRDKSATTWAEAKRIISDANSNRQCTADLNVEPTSEAADPNVQSVARLEAKPVVELGRLAWERLSTDQQRRRESIDASATLIHSLDECEIELLADCLTLRGDIKARAQLSRVVELVTPSDGIADTVPPDDEKSEQLREQVDIKKFKYLSLKIGAKRCEEMARELWPV